MKNFSELKVMNFFEYYRSLHNPEKAKLTSIFVSGCFNFHIWK